MDKFPDFILDACEINNSTLIMNYLKENPANILQTLADGRNIVHLAVQSNNFKFFKMICERVKATKNFHLFGATDHSGWNSMHYAARFSGLEITKYLLKMLGPMATHSINSVVNSRGVNALQLVKDNKDKNKKAILAVLRSIAYRHNMPALSELINKKLILAQYPKASPQLQKNLTLACEAINQTRSTIKSSSTHPEANYYYKPQFRKVIEDINELRKKINKHKEEASKERKLTSEEKLNISADHIRQAKVGNCQEFSFLCLQTVRNLDPSVNGSIYHIDNDDHVFTVIGRAPGSDPRDYKTWGEEAVVCDPWSGAVYPASEIPKKLKYYWFDSNFKQAGPHNVVGPFNEKFHILAEALSILADSKLVLDDAAQESKLPLVPGALPRISTSEIKYLSERSFTPKDNGLNSSTEIEFPPLSTSSSSFYIPASSPKKPSSRDLKKFTGLLAPLPKKNKP